MSKTYINAALRREVIARANQCCEYCLLAQADVFFALEVDHIIAEKHGGATHTDNLCLACPDCNAYKGSDVASVDWQDDAQVVALYNPRQQQWATHFQLNAETGAIDALTATGRVTVTLLRLNDPDRIVDRKLLLDAARYPCARA